MWASARERLRELECAGREGAAFPSPLVGEGVGRSETDEGSVKLEHPSSGPSGHLLPQGEKDSARSAAIPLLTGAERDVHQAGLISVLKEIHDDIDRAVLTAYGWEDLIPRLVGKPGATLPSPYKTADQEAAEEELLTRLVALNQERAAEEKRGLVRWLRPDYQIPKLGAKAPRPADEHVGELDIVVPDAGAGKPKWPADGLEQIKLVRDVLAKAPSPTLPDAISASFDGKANKKRNDRVAQVLDTLVPTGVAREVMGEGRYFLPR